MTPTRIAVYVALWLCGFWIGFWASAALAAEDANGNRAPQHRLCATRDKYADAQCILPRRGVRIDREQLRSWDYNEGTFHSARALADWVQRGDR